MTLGTLLNIVEMKDVVLLVVVSIRHCEVWFGHTVTVGGDGIVIGFVDNCVIFGIIDVIDVN